MSIVAGMPIREIVAELPSSVAVLEGLGIDYCCGGDQTLEQACLRQGLSVGEVVTTLEASERSTRSGGPEQRDWKSEPLAELISIIINKHHQFTWQTLRELGPLFEKVCAKHGDNHPELRAVHRAVRDLEAELTAHMFKEETILFPSITQMEEAARKGGPQPSLFFGSLQNPVSVMIRDHDHAGENLKRIHDLTAGYAPPPDACASYRALFEKLKALEQDLHYHIYLENYLLFPRALAMDKAAD